MNIFKKAAHVMGAGLMALAFSQAAMADEREIGEVDTVWRALGPNDKIKIMAFEDPEIKGVTCWLSRPTKGGISGGLGLAEDKSNASIACRQTGPIEVTGTIERGKDGEEVFNESRSIWFKELHVTRFFDEAANTLVYLTYSDKLIDGSPKNSLSTVVMKPWNEQGVAPIIK